MRDGPGGPQDTLVGYIKAIITLMTQLLSVMGMRIIHGWQSACANVLVYGYNILLSRGVRVKEAVHSLD